MSTNPLVIHIQPTSNLHIYDHIHYHSTGHLIPYFSSRYISESSPVLLPNPHRSYLTSMLRLFLKRQNIARNFVSSAPSRKGNNKNDLKRLGGLLHNGKVGDDSVSTTRKSTDLELDTKPEPTPAIPAELALDIAVKKNINELEDNFETVAFMTKDDVAIQENFDQGNQFGSFSSEHFLDRKALIRSLPDEIDIVNTPWEEIDRIYNLLKKLDEDRSVHLRYVRRFGIDPNDLITRLRMGNNLEDMCRAGRRGERYEMPKGLERVFKRLYEYNVVGFDRSIVGVPLRSSNNGKGNQNNVSRSFPVEMISDMRPFDTKVPVHKADVNFLDDDQLKESILPYDPKPLPPEDLLRDVGKPIFIDNIDNYRKIGHHLAEFLNKIEKETLSLKDLLYLEIARKMIPTGVDVVNVNAPKMKTSEYVIASKDHDATTTSGPTTSYRFKNFDLIPIDGMVLATTKHHNNLYKHLFKVILINLDEHIDVLTRIKYTLPDEARAFTRKLYGKIHRILFTKLMPLALEHRLKVPPKYHAVLHKHMLSLNFLRLCWIRKPFTGLRLERKNFSRNVRRNAHGLNVLILNPINLLN